LLCTSVTTIYTLSLHDALPIFDLGDLVPVHPEHPVHVLLVLAVAGERTHACSRSAGRRVGVARHQRGDGRRPRPTLVRVVGQALDRKSTRLNSSHSQISYAVFC